MVSLISQELMKNNMNLFQIFGMKEERFILMKSKKFSNTEWMKLQNFKNKNNQLSE